MDVDTSFDVRSDSKGRDPDSSSQTLRRFHQQLWNGKLQSGDFFELTRERGSYLQLTTSFGEWNMTSDSIVNTYTQWSRASRIVGQVSREELDSFLNVACTVGAYIVFPVRSDLKPTLNQARGTRRLIDDRFDLTLECIRRFYTRELNPLDNVLRAYADYFMMFQGFDEFVNFFHLNDLVDPVSGRVRFFLPFDDFTSPGVPSTVDEYTEYRGKCMEFIAARNSRISAL